MQRCRCGRYEKQYIRTTNEQMKKRERARKNAQKITHTLRGQQFALTTALSLWLALSLSPIPAQTERFFAQTERRQLDEFSSHLTLEVFW